MQFSGLEYLPIITQPLPLSPAELFLRPEERLFPSTPSPMLLPRPGANALLFHLSAFDSSRNLVSRSMCSLFFCDQLGSLSTAVQPVTERPSFPRLDKDVCCMCVRVNGLLSQGWIRAYAACVYHVFGPLACFRLSAIVKNAGMNMDVLRGVRVPIQLPLPIPWGMCTKQISGLYGSSVLKFLKNLHIVFQ